MATLEKINIVLGDLEKTHGATIPIADLRQSMARVYEELASSASSSKAPASNSETCAAFTKPAKKSDAPKQCSKKGTNIGTDDKHYCAIHFEEGEDSGDIELFSLVGRKEAGCTQDHRRKGISQPHL
jgi:hypothetical protein